MGVSLPHPSSGHAKTRRAPWSTTPVLQLQWETQTPVRPGEGDTCHACIHIRLRHQPHHRKMGVTQTAKMEEDCTILTSIAWRTEWYAAMSRRHSSASVRRGSPAWC